MTKLMNGPIKDFTLGIYDGPHATPRESEEGPIFLGIKNVSPDGRLDYSEIRHVSEQDFPKWTKRVTPQVDDIVFSYEATLHRYAIIPEGFRGCLGRRMALVRPDKEKVHPRFLHYYFMASQWRAVVEANILSGATVDRIPIKRFPNFEVKLPQRNIQERIASILSAYDDLIENNRRRIQSLEQAAQLLYKEWFVQFRFPGHEHVTIKDGVPEEWEKGVVRDLGEVVTGKTPITKVEGNYRGNIPFVKTPDMHKQLVVVSTEQTLTEQGANSQRNKYIPAWSIIVSCIGTVGVTCLTSKLCQTNQQINAIIPSNKHYSYFAFFVFRDLKPHLEAMGGGATMPNVNKTKFSSLPILLPEEKLIIIFDEIVRPMFEQILNLTLMNQSLTQTRDLLLPRLMNGKTAV